MAHGDCAMKSPEYPRGKLNPEDEGSLEIGIGAKDGTVMVVFPKPVKWFALSVHEARDLARMLKKRARKAEKQVQ